MTLLRPQLCGYQCEVLFEEVDENGHAIMLDMIRQCVRHRDLSKEEAFAAICAETDLHNAAIEAGIDSASCYMEDGELKWLPA